MTNQFIPSSLSSPIGKLTKSTGLKIYQSWVRTDSGLHGSDIQDKRAESSNFVAKRRDRALDINRLRWKSGVPQWMPRQVITDFHGRK